MNPSEQTAVHIAVMKTLNVVVITSADPMTGYSVITANPAFAPMTGYTLEENNGQSLQMLQGPDTDTLNNAE